jgi:Na+/H+ antiporter NhaD/arsenite permease-like protein
MFYLIPTFVCSVASASEASEVTLGTVLPVWSVIPFAGLLLSIAIIPMVFEHWWHDNKHQLLVAVAWSTPVLGYMLYLMATNDHGLADSAGHALNHAFAEYISFIGLLASLYIISGGILLRGDLRAKPLTNLTFLAVGGVLANVIGTTGASMLLIRPILRTNSERKHTWHIPLFFIFVVSNVGGALTPIGDPPLFLGYLRGVPFWWTLTNLWHIWVPTMILILGIFYALDSYQYRREDEATITYDMNLLEPLAFEGKINFLLLAGVVGSVLFLSPVQGVHDFREYYVREIAMGLLAGGSLLLTSSSLRQRNQFNYGPILEVGALFIGIFVAMIPATALLETYGSELGLTEAWHYFWATGGLSAFLDNAPTYVTFAAVACNADLACVSANDLAPLALGEGAPMLVAISLGSVLLGAGSYIGNGPNFMVRAIAENSGYKMPSFFGYCGYAMLFLLPVYILITMIYLV